MKKFTPKYSGRMLPANPLAYLPVGYTGPSVIIVGAESNTNGVLPMPGEKGFADAPARQNVIIDDGPDWVEPPPKPAPEPEPEPEPKPAPAKRSIFQRIRG